VLDRDASHEEAVEGYARRLSLSRLLGRREALLELGDHVGREREAEALQRGLQLTAVDQARVVLVEALEDPVPVLRELAENGN
jgi:hypothetical protein